MPRPPNLPDQTQRRTVPRTVKGPCSRYVEVASLPTGGTRYDLKPAGYGVIERMSREGRDLASVAAALGLSNQGFLDLRKRDPAAVDAVDRGRAALGDELTDILLVMARKGNVTAAIWLDKTRRGIREDQPMDGARVVNNTQININLPQPREREDYLRLVSGQGAPVVEHQPKKTETADGDA